MRYDRSQFLPGLKRLGRRIVPVLSFLFLRAALAANGTRGVLPPVVCRAVTMVFRAVVPRLLAILVTGY